MGCSTCGRRRGITTNKIRIKVDKPIGAVKTQDIKKKLEIYAKELINQV